MKTTSRGFSTVAARRFYPLICGRVNVKNTCANWDEVLRLPSSIRLGTVTASEIHSKLANYPRQNALAKASRENGKIERTLFTLRWLQDPDLRCRVTAGLNKGKARNALARAVFFNRLGESRERSHEHQMNRAGRFSLDPREGPPPTHVLVR